MSNLPGHHAREVVCSVQDGFQAQKPRPKAKNANISSKPAEPLPEVTTQRLETLATPQLSRVEDISDEEMLDATDDFVSNAVPWKFLSGPGLSSAEAFNTANANAEKKLEELGIPIPMEAGTHKEDLESQARESEHHI